jgi:hypothetical protein
VSRIRAAYHDPHGTRYGLPTFTWGGAPQGFATLRQLRAAGLRPGGQPVAAQILWRGTGGTRAAYLYRIDLANPSAPPLLLSGPRSAKRYKRGVPARAAAGCAATTSPVLWASA